MDVATISSLAGLLSLGGIILISIFGGFLYVRGGIGEKTTSAQNNAISALQSELSSLRRKAEDEERNRAKLEHVIDTIILALKAQGIVITVQGELVQIEVEDKKRTIATIKVQDM